MDHLINPELAKKDQIEIQVKKQQKQEYKLLGSIIMKRGLHLFEFDYEKMTLKKAEIVKNKLIDFETKNKVEKDKVIFNHNAYYFQSHCYRTAAKKANKIIQSATGELNYFK